MTYMYFGTNTGRNEIAGLVSSESDASLDYSK